MDFHRYDDYPRTRGPFAAWVLATLIGVILGGAALAAALTTDTRDFAARQQTVHGRQAL